MGFAPSTMRLSSPSFGNLEPIPSRHSYENENLSPALEWSNPPEGTEQFAILCHDPDAPLVTANGTYGFVHWLMYNIPANVRLLPEGCRDFTVGVNNFSEAGWGGPLPPEGHGQHHYYFWILALGHQHNFPVGLQLWPFLATVENDILGMNRLIGTYQRG